MASRSNRRDFLQTTAATGIGFWVAAGVQAQESKSPNEAIAMACIGIGGKGSSDSADAGTVGRHGRHLRRRREHGSNGAGEEVPQGQDATPTSARCSTRWARASTRSPSARPTTPTPRPR